MRMTSTSQNEAKNNDQSYNNKNSPVAPPVVVAKGNNKRESVTGSSSSPPIYPKHVLVDRVYNDIIAIRFSTQFPKGLIHRLDEEIFNYTVTQINGMFQHAEKYSCKTCCQTFLGYLTVSFIYSCWQSKYEKCLSDISSFVSDQNKRVFLPHGLLLIDPTLKGLRNLEIIFLDPPNNNTGEEKV